MTFWRNLPVAVHAGDHVMNGSTPGPQPQGPSLCPPVPRVMGDLLCIAEEGVELCGLEPQEPLSEVMVCLPGGAWPSGCDLIPSTFSARCREAPSVCGSHCSVSREHMCPEIVRPFLSPLCPCSCANTEWSRLTPGGSLLSLSSLTLSTMCVRAKSNSRKVAF